MFGFIAQTVSGALAPLADQVSATFARILRKLVLFVVAALCLVVVIAALTLAFGLWIATLAGTIAGVLSVAGLYLLVAIVAIVLAMKAPKQVEDTAGQRGDSTQGGTRSAKDRADLDSQIDTFTAPLMGILQSLGLRREQLAVFAGASVAKRLGPVPLVGLAIVAGFLIGRTYKSWQGLISLETISTLMASAGLFGFDAKGESDAEGDDEPRTTDTKKAA